MWTSVELLCRWGTTGFPLAALMMRLVRLLALQVRESAVSCNRLLHPSSSFLCCSPPPLFFSFSTFGLHATLRQLPWDKYADDPLDTKFPYVVGGSMRGGASRPVSDRLCLRLFLLPAALPRPVPHVGVASRLALA